MSRRSGMFEAVIPPAPCGLSDGIEPKMPDETLGSLGLTDATSKRIGAAGVGACANARGVPDAQGHNSADDEKSLHT